MTCFRHWFYLVLLAPLVSTASPDAITVATLLDANRTNIAAELTARLSTNVLRGSYTTVWRQFEEAAVAGLEEILPRLSADLSAKNFDVGSAGHEKNRLADLAIVCGTNRVEVSVKASRRSGQPENDMGTFRDHPSREKLFAASFTVWVRYEDTGKTLHATRVFFDRTWRFVGRASQVDGVKYRKKDGNMRPKPWSMFESGQAFWKSAEDFEAAVKRAETFRANELVKEYLSDLSEDDQRILHDKLHRKFESPPIP